jgi:hypothetical protein
VVVSIQVERCNYVFGLNSFSVDVHYGSVNFIIVAWLFLEKVYSEPLDGRCLSRTDNSETTCILDGGIFGSQVLYQLLNV